MSKANSFNLTSSHSISVNSDMRVKVDGEDQGTLINLEVRKKVIRFKIKETGMNIIFFKGCLVPVRYTTLEEELDYLKGACGPGMKVIFS